MPNVRMLNQQVNPNLDLNKKNAIRKSITRLANIMALITAVACAAIFILAWLSGMHIYYLLFCLILPFLYYLVILLNRYIKRPWANIYGTAILPLWVNIAVVLGGGGFAESTAMTAFVIFTYVLFAKSPRLKYTIIVFNVITHIIAITYAAYNPPLVTRANNPFDEAIVFVLCLGWLAVILKQHEYVRDKLIFKLQTQNNILRETTEELERFSYIASHDLKSPLRTIISFSDLLESNLKNGQTENLMEYLNYVRSGAKQMNFLINDILEFSRINGNEEAEKVNLDLNLVMEKVKANLHHEIQQRNAKLESSILPAYFGNETEFILLFQNIIQNGIKYNSSEFPEVSVWGNQSDTQIQINFKDNGIGIDPKYHKTIFQLFKRLHNQGQYEGTGLGLGVCQKLVRKYDGNISVSSSPGAGSTFTIELPIVKERKQNAEAQVASTHQG